MCRQDRLLTMRILRARGGSSHTGEPCPLSNQVFSAHAEVVPRLCKACYGRTGILRARGGSSTSDKATSKAIRYSPRTRR